MTLLNLDDPSTREHVTRCKARKHTLRTPESALSASALTAHPSWASHRAGRSASQGPDRVGH